VALTATRQPLADVLFRIESSSSIRHVGPVVTQPRTPESGSLAEVMAGMPEVWRRLLAAHVADRMGRCAACRTSSGSGSRWPCTLHRIATEAERLYGLRLGQAVGGG
jgi:hypothetical protein